MSQAQSARRTPKTWGEQPSRHSEVRAKANELLADGEWHNFERVMGQLIRVVPPGPAFRRGELRRLSAGGTQRPNVHPERVIPRTSDEVIRFGARSIVNDTLRYMDVEIDPPGRVPRGVQKRLRLRPDRDVLTESRFTDLQMQVLRLVNEGFSPPQIAKELGTSRQAPRDSLNRIFKKFGVSNSHALIRKARTMGLVASPPMSPREFAALQLMREKKYHAWQYAAKAGWSREDWDRHRRLVLHRYGVDRLEDLLERASQWERDGLY